MSKKVLNFIKSIMYLRDDVIPQYVTKFDEAVRLYKNRKIEKSNSLMMIINGLKYKKTVDKSLKSLQKYTTYEPVIGIKKLNSVYNPDRQFKKFHILAKVTMNVKYKSGKQNNKLKVNKETFTESRVIIAKTKNDALDIMKEDIKYEYDIEESWRNSTVDEVDFVSVLPIKQEVYKTDVTTMRMKELGSKILNYNHIKEYKDFLQTDREFGTCVIDNIVGMYHKTLHITRESFINFCKKYYKQNASPLDFDLDVQEWSEEDGIDSNCIQSFCQYYDISHYCYDITNSCVLKYVSKSQNHEALFYFCINEHMYLVRDKDIKNRLKEWAKDKKEINVKSSLFEMEYEKTNIFNEFKIVENVDLNKVTDYDSCIFMFTRINGKNDLNDIFQEFIKIYNEVPTNINAMNHKINYFECKLNDKKYFFVLDANQSCIGVTYKNVMKLCKQNEIEFKNQSFVTLINQIKDIFFNDVNKRIKFDKEFREQILTKHNNKCNICKCKLDEEKFHIDHVRPLSNGGSNDDDNLQILCLECHDTKSQDEQENGIYRRVSETESSFNKQVTDIINSNLAKSYAFVETLNDNIYNKKVFTMDKNKCRKNELYYSKYDFPVFTVMDTVEKYDGQHGTGLYYIESENYIPLRGNGWYYYPMVHYCLKHKLIEPYQIKYVVLASLSIPGNYYNKFIDYCYSKLGKFDKLSINSMIGAFNINLDKHVNSKTIGVVKGAYKAYLKHFDNDNSFLNSFEINGETYYHMYKDVKSVKYETELAFYNQIIQMENILIHKMKTMIESKNGTVLDLNTDAVSCIFPDDVFPFKLLDDGNLDDFFHDEDKKEPMFKLENKDRLKHERCKQMIRTETYKYKKEQWTEYEDVKDNDFTPLVNTILDSNKSFNILGRAGCGKSTLIKKIQKKLNENNKKYITLCPTNKACLVIKDAVTLCKFSNKFKNKSVLKNLSVDYIFVDEISMVHEMYYKFLQIIKQIKPNVIFIISGDFEQLKPVCDRVDVDYKNSRILFELCDGNRLNLSICRRSDDKLFNLCKAPHTIKKGQFGNKQYKLNLCYTNKKRIEINEAIMKQQVKKYGSGLKLKATKNPNSQDIELLKNMPIIAIKTDSKFNIVNNEMFTIKSICRGIIEIENELKGVIEIPVDKFQHLFFIAYAITIHKSQGSTFDKSYTIHEWSKLDNTLKYVALSRATDIKLINIVDINEVEIKDEPLILNEPKPKHNNKKIIDAKPKQKTKEEQINHVEQLLERYISRNKYPNEDTIKHLHQILHNLKK